MSKGHATRSSAPPEVISNQICLDFRSLCLFARLLLVICHSKTIKFIKNNRKGSKTVASHESAQSTPPMSAKQSSEAQRSKKPSNPKQSRKSFVTLFPVRYERHHWEYDHVPVTGSPGQKSLKQLHSWLHLDNIKNSTLRIHDRLVQKKEKNSLTTGVTLHKRISWKRMEKLILITKDETLPQ